MRFFVTALLALVLAAASVTSISLIAVLQPFATFSNSTSVRGAVRISLSNGILTVNANFTGLNATTDYRFYITESLNSLNNITAYGTPSTFLLGATDTTQTDADPVCHRASTNQESFFNTTDSLGNFTFSATIDVNSTLLLEADRPLVSDYSGLIAHIAGRGIAFHAKNVTCGVSPNYLAFGVLGYEYQTAALNTTGLSTVAKFYPPNYTNSAVAGRAYIFPTMVDACRQSTAGVVFFTTNGNNVDVSVKLRNLIKAQVAIHVHEFGDISDYQATNTGGHFNPLNASHACPASFSVANKLGHVGDLGNFDVTNQLLDASISSSLMKLDDTTNSSVFGRAVVVHASFDDCKQGSSVTYTGSSGVRYAYGVIGRYTENKDSATTNAASVPSFSALNVAKATAPPCRVVLSAILQGTPTYAAAYARVEVISSAANILSFTITGANFPVSTNLAARILTDANLVSGTLGSEVKFGTEAASGNSCGSTTFSTSQSSLFTNVSSNGNFSQTVTVNVTGLYSASLTNNYNMDRILVSLAGRPFIIRTYNCVQNQNIEVVAYGVLGFSNFSGPIPPSGDLDASTLVGTAPTYAVALMFPTLTNSSIQKTSGFVTFEKTSSSMIVTPYLVGHLAGQVAAIHVHANGDIGDFAGTRTSSHFNPLKAYHACPAGFNLTNNTGHVGDLGNFNFASNGRINMDKSVSTVISSNNLMTFGVNDATNILGRAVVVHAMADDCSQTSDISYTGNAGLRFSYGVIGIVSSLNATALRDLVNSQLNSNGYFLDSLNFAKVLTQATLPSSTPSPSVTPSVSMSVSPTASISMGASPSASASVSPSPSVQASTVVIPPIDGDNTTNTTDTNNTINPIGNDGTKGIPVHWQSSLLALFMSGLFAMM